MNTKVMLTIKAATAAEALLIARSIEGLTLDERYGAQPSSLEDETFVLSGEATEEISDPRVQEWPNSQMELFRP